MKSFVKFLLNRSKLIVLNTFFNNKIEKTAIVHSTCIINSTTIGNFTYVGPNVVINDTTIGNYCSIAPNVVIGGMEHDYTNYSTSTQLCDYIHLPPTKIEDDVWIGAGVYVRAGINLGKGCIIGSNATVLSDVPSFAIAVGSPAKVIKLRFDDPVKAQNYKLLDFNTSREELINKIKSL